MSHIAVEVTTYLDPELAEALKQRAAREERPISAEIRRLIKASLTDQGPAENGSDRRSRAPSRAGAGARDTR